MAKGLITAWALAALLAASAMPVRAERPAGQVLERLKMPSKILPQPLHYSIYLPPDYQSSSRRYPVVYLLHGFTDDDSGWIQFGEVNAAADRGIEAREIPPLIIVMPDAGVTWYVNDYKGEVRYEDMFVRELIPFIDTHYRTRSGREFRGVAGLSMGGHGALLLALHHPDLFGGCAAFSSALFTDEAMAGFPDDAYPRYFSNLFGEDLKGQARLNEHWRRNNPLDLARTLPEEQLKKVRWYLDCGDDDGLSSGNSALHELLRERKIPHEYRVRDGGHTWSYWRTGIYEGLRFIGESFHR